MGRTTAAILFACAKRGLHRRYGQVPDEVRQRLDYEIGVIDRMGYINYYLIVYDFINYARQRAFQWGRAAALAREALPHTALASQILTPFVYQLLFERFLNPERVSMPDFDVDFCYERRGEVIDYVIHKYGADHVAQIVTFGTMAARAVIRDVGRVLDMPYQQVDAVAKLVPMEPKMTLQKALKASKELARQYEQDPLCTN